MEIKTESKEFRGRAYRVARENPAPRAEPEDYACVGADPRLFDPRTPGELAAARSYCAGCPMRRGCGRLGLQRQEWGVWGGLLLDAGRVIDKPRKTRRGRPAAVPIEALAG